MQASIRTSLGAGSHSQEACSAPGHGWGCSKWNSPLFLARISELPYEERTRYFIILDYHQKGPFKCDDLWHLHGQRLCCRACGRLGAFLIHLQLSLVHRLRESEAGSVLARPCGGPEREGSQPEPPSTAAVGWCQSPRGSWLFCCHC